jgi:hypothetical protein
MSVKFVLAGTMLDLGMLRSCRSTSSDYAASHATKLD